MKHPFIILMLIVFPFTLISCRTTKKVIQQETQNTSIETRYERIYIPDTVMVEIPRQISSVVTLDTTSTLENDYAISRASVDSLGRLHHQLETKAQKMPMPINKEIQRIDSIVYVDKEVKVPVTVERELSWWERTSIKWFPYSLCAIALSLCIIFRNPLLAFIRRYI